MIKVYGVPQSRAFPRSVGATRAGPRVENVPTKFRGRHARGGIPEAEPERSLPVLVDGTTVLWESMAINLYLARQYGAGTLWPAIRSRRGTGVAVELLGQTEVEASLLQVLMHRRILPKEQRDAAVAGAAETKLAGPFGVLDGALRGREYLLGGSFTIADLNVASVLSSAGSPGDLARWPQLAAWLARCTERPACKAARLAATSAPSILVRRARRPRRAGR